MAGRRVDRPQAARFALAPQIADPIIGRALDQLRASVQDVQSTASVFTVQQDLKVGTNIIEHSLGRAVKSVTLTPSVADASFGWAMTTTGNPHPDRQVLIVVVGVDQPGTYLEFR